APATPLPRWRFHAIEFPGRVHSLAAAVHALGGAAAIEHAGPGIGTLELRFRPGDPFCHPVMGDVIGTSNLLMKVTKRRSRRTGRVEVKTEVVGAVAKTCRFRAIADFQVIVDRNDPLFIVRRDIAQYNIHGMSQFEFSHDKGQVAELRNMPPPVFSRIEWPLQYGYRENTNVVRVMVQKTGQAPVLKLVNRQPSQKVPYLRFSKTDAEVPAGPTPAILAVTASLPADALQCLRELFGLVTPPTTNTYRTAPRPVWTRLALHNTLPARLRRHLKYVVPQVAYAFTFGAWKPTWVRYGYDPRRERAARMYQVVRMRFVKERAAAGGGRAKRLVGVEDAVGLVKRAKGKTSGAALTPGGMDVDEEGGGGGGEGGAGGGLEEDDSHRFDGVWWKGAAGIQICDISDPDVVKIIKSNRGLRKTSDVRQPCSNPRPLALSDTF
ncbi:RNA polymerase III transcription factor IIIC subunit-domain-containing protein, partial [Zopfochytrium polystomum]